MLSPEVQARLAATQNITSVSGVTTISGIVNVTEDLLVQGATARVTKYNTRELIEVNNSTTETSCIDTASSSGNLTFAPQPIGMTILVDLLGSVTSGGFPDTATVRYTMNGNVVFSNSLIFSAPVDFRIQATLTILDTEISAIQQFTGSIDPSSFDVGVVSYDRSVSNVLDVTVQWASTDSQWATERVYIDVLNING